MPDSALEVFESFSNGGLERIRQAIAENEDESVLLDFKQYRSENWNLIFSKAASAFANTNGGVIVWGVASEQKIEKGTGRYITTNSDAPVSGLSDFLGHLESTTPHVLDRPVSGLHHIKIPSVGDDTGYVVTFVPESVSAPHQAKDGIYYMRSGWSSVRMPHRQVEAMVLARQLPRFELYLDSPGVVAPANTVDFGKFGFKVGLRNVGVTAATNLALTVRATPAYTALSTSEFCLPPTPIQDESGSLALVRLLPQIVLYPGIGYTMISVVMPISGIDTYGAGFVVEAFSTEVSERFEFTVASTDHVTRHPDVGSGYCTPIDNIYRRLESTTRRSARQ